MIPLMELLMQGGNGAALDAIARQIGISRADAERAAEALMPAFSQGLKRNVSDPMGFMRFMAALAGGGHQDYFDNPGMAASDSGLRDGEAILGNLFGGKEVSRAIAAQAAQATGLSQAMMKQMLPMMAPILLGGLFKQMTGQTQAAQASAAANPLGRILEQMMGGGAGYREGGGGFGGGAGNPWGQILEEMMRGGGQSPRGRQPQGAEDPFGRILEEMLGGSRRGGRPGDSGRGGAMPDNPLGDIFQEMLRGRRPAAPQEPSDRYEEEPEPRPEARYRRQEPRAEHRDEDPEPQSRREAAPEPRNKTYRPPDDGEPQASTRGGLEDLFGQMFETGRATQKEYQRGVEQIFEQFFGGGKTGR